MKASARNQFTGTVSEVLIGAVNAEIHVGLQGIGIYTSTGPFSLEGEGWDEGDINGCFYSPHPNPLQQERGLVRLVTHCIYNAKKMCRYLCLQGGETIVASITKDSAETLGIKTGMEVMALVKAPQIIIVTDFGGYRLSARNQLQGTVTGVKPGAVNAEVDIELKGGEKVAATVTNDSVEALGLSKGKPATAVFKAGAVILAVAV